MDFRELQKALQVYSSKGWRVFRVHTILGNGQCSCGKYDCNRKGKHPVVKGWQSEATADPAKIKEWWNSGSDILYNIGIACGEKSGITVVDIDEQHGGMATWQQICEKHDIPDSYSVETGNGGFHIYFKYTPAVPTKTDTLGKGIDTRNDGGYVIAPPSQHVSGNQYKADLDNVELVDCPNSIIAIANQSPTEKLGNPNGRGTDLTLPRAKKLLEFIDATDYQVWLNVGIILGRVFNRSDPAWELYNEWADNYDGDKSSQSRNDKMHEAFYDLSQKQSNNKKGELNAATLYFLAQKGGWKPTGHNTPIDYLCYVANENAFLYMVNGDKWLASAVDGMCAPVIEDGIKTPASKYIIANRPASLVVNEPSLPLGYVKGYDISDGCIQPLPTSAVVNIYMNNVITVDEEYGGSIANHFDKIITAKKREFNPTPTRMDFSKIKTQKVYVSENSVMYNNDLTAFTIPAGLTIEDMMEHD